MQCGKLGGLQVVSTAATFRVSIKGALDARHVTFDAFSKELERILMSRVNNLAGICLPDNLKVPGCEERAKMVDKVLDDFGLALATLAPGSEETVATFLLASKPSIQALMVAIGDIDELHPKLFPALAFSVFVLLIPQDWILRPLLCSLGFGPAGPVKGSFAACLQKQFWGGAVEPGSWFSLLQAVGMGANPDWISLIAKEFQLVGNLSALAKL